MYLIAVDGWKAELAVVEDKEGEIECDLVPKYLVVNRYFASEKQAIEELQTKLDKKNIQAKTDSGQASNEGVTVV